MRKRYNKTYAGRHTKREVNRRVNMAWILIVLFLAVGVYQQFTLMSNDMTIPAIETKTYSIERLIEITNEDRIENELIALEENENLKKSAEMKVNDMFDRQYFEHDSPEGVTPWHWINESGYDYAYAGENLAMNFDTPEEAQIGLMNSPLHRDNILDEKYTNIGVAIKTGDIDGEITTIIVYHFGTPKLEFTSLAVVIEPQETKEIVAQEVRIANDIDPNRQEVKDYVIQETTKQGLNTNLYLAIINCESGFDRNVKNNVSTATGACQFTAGTWLDGVRWRGLDWSMEDRKDYRKALNMMIWFVEVKGEISRWDCINLI